MSGSAPDTGELRALLTSAIAQACGCPPSEITGSTQLVVLGMDSLTLVSVLAQMEAFYGFELTADDTLPLLVAQDVDALTGELEAIVARSRAKA